jgi:hypothetical protein
VRQADVGLRFHGSFPGGPSTLHHVRFKLQRIPLRRQHQALDIAFTAERLLFPKTVYVKPARSIVHRIEPFNALVAGNAPQLTAVKAIVNLGRGSVPFILFGPCVPVLALKYYPANFPDKARDRQDHHRRRDYPPVTRRGSLRTHPRLHTQ